mgnify:CR=1 FL=1
MKKNKDLLIGLLAVAVIIGGLIWVLPKPPEKKPPTASVNTAITPEEKYFDFGSISMAAGKVKHTYLVKNDSDRPLTVDKVYTSCMCTEASLINNGKKSGPFGMPGHGFSPGLKEVIGPQSTAEVEAEFDPAAHGPAGVGLIERSVIIEYEGVGQTELSFSAQVTP